VRAPENTYIFTSPTDVAGPTLGILSRHFQVSASTTLHVFTFSELAKDRILVLNNVTVAADPGATQVVLALAVEGITQAGLNFSIALKRTEEVADQQEALNWSGEVWIQGAGVGNDSLRITALYDVGTNSNAMLLGFAGLVIPHGNASAF